MSTQPAISRPRTKLCAYCTELRSTHRFPKTGKCDGGAAKGYNNCFNMNNCEAMKKNSDADVLLGIIESGALSCNYTTRGREIVEGRLRKIAATLKEAKS